MTHSFAGDRVPRVNFRRLKAIHCYTAPWEDIPGGTPEPLMIAALDLATDKEDVFAVHLIAERNGVPPAEIPGRRRELERQMLEEFYDFVRADRRGRWLHWNMGSVLYGFPAMAQRFRALGGTPADLPEHRLINLAVVLKRAFGEDYAPHPRLENLITLNGLSDHGWLSLTELTGAARAGEYGRMLRSLVRRVRSIASLFALFIRGELLHQGRPSKLCPLRLAASQVPYRGAGEADARRESVQPPSSACRLGARKAAPEGWRRDGPAPGPPEDDDLDRPADETPSTTSKALQPAADGQRPDGPEPPRFLWWQGERHVIGGKKSRRLWDLLSYMWGRDSATYQELVGPDKPWRDAVCESAFSSAVNRLNNLLPRSLPWRLAVGNYCVVKEPRGSPESHRR